MNWWLNELKLGFSLPHVRGDESIDIQPCVECSHGSSLQAYCDFMAWWMWLEGALDIMILAAYQDEQYSNSAYLHNKLYKFVR